MINKNIISKSDKWHKRSIVWKFSFSAVIIVLVQVIIFASAFMLWGAASAEKKQCYRQFKNTVAARGSFLENAFSNKQLAVKHFQDSIVKQIEDTSEKYSNTNGVNPVGNRLYNEQLLVEIKDEITGLLDTTNTKGAFIALATDSVGDFHQGLYVRLNDDNEKELLIGDESLTQQLQINKADKWHETFRITDAIRCGYYNRVEEAVRQGENAGKDECGCISPKFTLHGDNKEIITYTVPIIDGGGNLYGVLGIEFDIDKIIAEMPFSELGNGHDNMYYIAYRNNETYALVKEVVSANAGTDITTKDGVIEYTSVASDSLVRINDKNNSYVAYMQEFDFEGIETDSMGDEWLIAGVVNEKNLLSDYYWNIIHTIILISIISVISAIVYIYQVVKFSRKMRNMTAQIKANSPRTGWHLDETHVEELEDFAGICENLFQKSLSYSKLAEAIDLINMPIGAIEYDENENHVFYTDRAAEILELHNTGDEGQYMDKVHFEAEMEVLKKSLKDYEDDKDTFYMIGKTGQDKYIKIKHLEYESKTIIAVMDVTSEIRERMKIEYERDHDVLTHLLNRRAFKTHVAQLLSKNQSHVAAIVMLDLDNLKYFNDTYGHDYGDKYICAAASVLGKISDNRTLVARISGDEFLIFLYGYDKKEEIMDIVENAHKNLKETHIEVPGGEQVKLRASAGIAWYPDDADELELLIRYADFAMYESKNNMKGTLKEFNLENYKKNEVLFSGSEALNRLLEDIDNVKYAFHPIVDAKSGEIFAYEVLMRPQIETLRSPADVMRLATAQSRLYDVEKITWKAALKAADVQKKPGDNFKLFINSVPNHELKGSDLQRIVDDYGHLLDRVVIEIIENEQADKHCMDSKFKWAQQYGMSIALDDFGAGYSNESTLLFINPKYVKIDMAMVMGISTDEDKQKIVQNLLSYTKPRGIKVIAEGIENYEDMDMLIKLGVDYMQGWYFMKPQFEIKDLDDKFKREIKECNEKWS